MYCAAILFLLIIGYAFAQALEMIRTARWRRLERAARTERIREMIRQTMEHNRAQAERQRAYDLQKGSKHDDK